jgi:hypothetical protein
LADAGANRATNERVDQAVLHREGLAGLDHLLLRNR